MPAADADFSRGDILAAIARVGESVTASREHFGLELTAVRRELADAARQTGERLARIETSGDTWFKETWPNASRVIEAQNERLRAVEGLSDLREKFDQLERRTDFLESWRWKMVGLAGGVGLCSGVIGFLLLKVLKL